MLIVYWILLGVVLLPPLGYGCYLLVQRLVWCIRGRSSAKVQLLAPEAGPSPRNDDGASAAAGAGAPAAQGTKPSEPAPAAIVPPSEEHKESKPDDESARAPKLDMHDDELGEI